MVDLYLNEKPRTKEWFPEHIPGLFKLSKDEVMDDIDYISANVPFARNISVQERERPSRCKRNKNRNMEKAEKERASAGIKVEEGPSKRARLQNKVDQAMKHVSDVKKTHKDIRQKLETIRTEILHFRDLNAQTERNIESSTQERDEVEQKYHRLQADYIQNVQSAEQSRAEYENRVNQLMKQLTEENKLITENADHLEKFKALQSEIKKRNDRISVLDQKCAVYEDILQNSSINQSNQISMLPSSPNTPRMGKSATSTSKHSSTTGVVPDIVDPAGASNQGSNLQNHQQTDTQYISNSLAMQKLNFSYQKLTKQLGGSEREKKIALDRAQDAEEKLRESEARVRMVKKQLEEQRRLSIKSTNESKIHEKKFKVEENKRLALERHITPLKQENTDKQEEIDQMREKK